MHKALTEYLEAIGVKDYTELTPEERATYEGWERILGGKDVKPETIIGHFKTELSKLHEELREVVVKGDRSLFRKTEAERRAIYLAARIENYKTLIMLVDTPTKQASEIEKRLEQLTIKAKANK